MSFKSHIAAIVVTGCLVAAPGPVQAEDIPQSAGHKWGAWTEFGGYGVNWTDARRGETTVWAPLVQDGRSLVFADLRGRFFDEGEREGNFALGYRRVGEYGWNPGFWVGLDRRHSGHDSEFNQVSFGLEALSPNWDLRLNAYVPLNDTELAAHTVSAAPTVEVTGGTILLIPGPITVSDLYEISFWGVDAEVGFRIPLERWGPGAFNAASLSNEEAATSRRHYDLRIFLGGYYFDHQDFDEQIAGPRLRAEWRIENIVEDWDGSRLTFEAAYQYDDVRDDQLEAGLRLRIPLGGGASTLNDAISPQEQRMTEGLKRDRDIVAQTKLVSTTGIGAPEAVEDAATGVDFDSVTIVANGEDFNAALHGAGSNALLVALGGGTNFASVAMLDNQTLLGGGGSLQVRGRTTGMLGTYVAPGVRPTFQTGGGTAILTADNAHIKSLDIQNHAAGISQVGQRLVVDDVGIAGPWNGIWGSGQDLNLTVRNSTFSGNHIAISVSGLNNTLLAQNNVFLNMGGDGIEVFADPPYDGVVYLGDVVATNYRNSITVVGNRFEGAFGGHLFRFQNGITTIAAGSTGNVDATSSSDGKCRQNFTATLIGSINFEGGVSVAHGNCVRRKATE
jgi:Inverse autotransporter, beta-domain